MVYSLVVNNTFGENLKRERVSAGYTQKQLAQKLGIAQQRISQWELGIVEPTLSSIIELIKALNVRFEDLVDIDEKTQ